MTHASIPDPAGGSPARGIQANAPGAARAARSPRDPRESGAAFRALLEKLELRASELAAETSRVEDPAALAGALDRARASLEEAASLSDELLEVYREARQQESTPGTPGAPGAGEREERP